uniref:Gustatory receptor n=1 Tax=Musca domestica TaxID=7370 RepID=A0A1I8NC04_MUSDO
MEISESSRCIYIVSKILGLAPFSVKKSDKGTYLVEKSIPFIIYASVLTSAMSFLTYRGLLFDATSKIPLRQSFRMKSVTSKAVTTMDVSVIVMAVTAGALCGIFGYNPTKELNVRLQKKEIQMQNIPKITPVLPTKGHEPPLHISFTKITSELHQAPEKNKSLLLKMLAECHESLGKCVELVSSSYGMAVLFILLSCFLHLVATSYFLFMEFLEKNSGGFSWLQVMWITFHTSRLLLVVEPCHRISAESSKTIHIICEIERGIHDSILAEEVNKFWQQQLVFKDRFSACGLVIVDRSLLTSIFSAIATYLVIIIQFQKSDG